MTHSLLEVDDLDPVRLGAVLDNAVGVEGRSDRVPSVLAGKGVAALFEKPSARTRISIEMAVATLGGHPDLHPRPKKSGSTRASRSRTSPARWRAMCVVDRGARLRPPRAGAHGGRRRRPDHQPAFGPRPSVPGARRSADAARALRPARRPPRRVRRRRQQRRRVARVRGRALGSRAPGRVAGGLRARCRRRRARPQPGRHDRAHRRSRRRGARRRRDLHRRLDVDGAGGRTGAAAARVRRLHRSTRR